MDETRAGILRYLGHRGQTVPEDIEEVIDECLPLMKKAVRLRHTAGEYPLETAEKGLVPVGSGLLLTGGDIAKLLEGCSRAVLFAATIGIEAERLIKGYAPEDLVKTLVLDACATQLIEEGCDLIEREIGEGALKRGLSVTGRFSPGYGDLPLNLQPAILAALDAPRRIGLTCTESLLFLPRKSVTAVIGLGEDICQNLSGCEACPLGNSCAYRKRG